MGVGVCTVTNMNKQERAPNLNDTAAAVIRGRMAQQKKTTISLAAALGISRQAAGRKAGGKTAITLDELAVIARWLETTPAEIVGEAWNY